MKRTIQAFVASSLLLSICSINNAFSSTTEECNEQAEACIKEASESLLCVLAVLFTGGCRAIDDCLTARNRCIASA